MKKALSVLMMIIFLVSSCKSGKKDVNIDMAAEWEKMNAQKKENIDWFNGAKFGMFIHWGIYSIPAGMWNGKTMEEMGRPRVAEWVQYVAKIPRDEYAKLAKEFNPVEFDADAIAAIARDAGMKYLVITTKHHDGFAMYDSKYSEFDIMDASPFKRDIIEELYNACKKYGIEFGIYYSHNIDWADGGDCQYSVIKSINDAKGLKTEIFGPNLWDPSPNSFDEYLQDKAFPQVKELLTRFPDIKLLWYDMSRYMLPEQSFEFYRFATSIQPQILINERVGNGFGDYDIAGDNKIPADPDYTSKPWETVGTLNNSWGYKSYDMDWKSTKELLFWLVEVSSKGGNYMLNIGPKASGEVPEQSIVNLKELGEWLKINGDAIYNTDKWKVTHEGPTKINMEGTHERQESGFKAEFSPEDFWYTCTDSHLFAIALEISENRKVVLRSLNTTNENKIIQVSILGSDIIPEWKMTTDGMEVTLPEVLPSEMGYVIAIEKKSQK